MGMSSPKSPDPAPAPPPPPPPVAPVQREDESVKSAAVNKRRKISNKRGRQQSQLLDSGKTGSTLLGGGQ